LTAALPAACAGRTSAALLKCLIAAALLGAALAAFDTDCTYPAEWVNNDKRIEGTSAPLSGCQVDLLNMAAADDILLGGKGERSWWDQQGVRG